MTFQVGIAYFFQTKTSLSFLLELWELLWDIKAYIGCGL